MFGKWMTKLGSVLLILPQVVNAIGNALNQHDAINEPISGLITTVGGAIAALGIRRAITPN